MEEDDELFRDLLRTVQAHCIDEHIVSSATVRWVLGPERLGERTANPEAIWNGGPFQTAETRACQEGYLQKWKRKVGRGVGWSPSERDDPGAFLRAQAWADRKGWAAIR
jgi:hypothetical protein